MYDAKTLPDPPVRTIKFPKSNEKATHLDEMLSKWAFDPQTLGVRLVKGKDGRDVLQMRVDMGILQLETTGRPDGESYEGHESV